MVFVVWVVMFVGLVCCGFWVLGFDWLVFCLVVVGLYWVEMSLVVFRFGYGLFVFDLFVVGGLGLLWCVLGLFVLWVVCWLCLYLFWGLCLGCLVVLFGFVGGCLVVLFGRWRWVGWRC